MSLTLTPGPLSCIGTINNTAPMTVLVRKQSSASWNAGDLLKKSGNYAVQASDGETGEILGVAVAAAAVGTADSWESVYAPTGDNLFRGNIYGSSGTVATTLAMMGLKCGVNKIGTNYHLDPDDTTNKIFNIFRFPEIMTTGGETGYGDTYGIVDFTFSSDKCNIFC